MSKKQLGIYIQVFGLLMIIFSGRVLPPPWGIVIGIMAIVIGGGIWRAGRKSETK